MTESGSAKMGVILMNLGTPSEPTAKGVRNFLKKFLSDPRVVEIPRLVWLPILYGVILPLRAKRVAKLYQQIWSEKGSPLKVITEQQVNGLQLRFSQEQVLVDYAMTYGSPSLEKQTLGLLEKGCERIVLLPLYPQYSATTTGAIYDQFARLIQSQRDVSDIHVHKQYFDDPSYIEALAQSIAAYRRDNGASDRLLFSFHGIPKRCVTLGDPYESQCRRTAELVAEAMGLAREEWAISFQSRLGKAEWLQPYTDKLLQRWAQDGVKSVDVVCPAFAADCLETIEEIDGENRELFLESGGEKFGFIPCLNSNETHIDLMEKIVRGYLPLVP